MALIKCPECGKEISDKAKVCPNCGLENNIVICPECNNKIIGNKKVCQNCGYEIVRSYNQSGSEIKKSKTTAALLAFFLGSFGVHNFYLGYYPKAVTQLSVTLVGIFLSIIFIGIFMVMGISIWAFVEFILILTGSIDKDANGEILI